MKCASNETPDDELHGNFSGGLGVGVAISRAQVREQKCEELKERLLKALLAVFHEQAQIAHESLLATFQVRCIYVMLTPGCRCTVYAACGLCRPRT